LALRAVVRLGLSHRSRLPLPEILFLFFGEIVSLSLPEDILQLLK
jgi:hypothetical protein